MTGHEGARPLEGRCAGCGDPLRANRLTLGYCSKPCRKVARVLARAAELDAVARQTGDYTKADAKFAAAAAMRDRIRAERAARR